MWDWQYFIEYYVIFPMFSLNVETYKKYFVEYCQSTKHYYEYEYCYVGRMVS